GRRAGPVLAGAALLVVVLAAAARRGLAGGALRRRRRSPRHPDAAAAAVVPVPGGSLPDGVHRHMRLRHLPPPLPAAAPVPRRAGRDAGAAGARPVALPRSGASA